jgi:cytochrome P450
VSSGTPAIETPPSREELVMHLERDQFVSETSRPVPRAALSSRVVTAMWALRVFVVVVGLMVIYTFLAQLH